MSDRKFGVEIECYSSNSVAGEWDDYEDCSDETADLFERNGLSEWAEILGSDDSLYSGSGVEIRSPILQGEEGLLELKKAVTLLNRNNYWVDDTCGLHVHHDAPEYIDDKNRIKRFVDAWMNNQDIIALMVDSNRWNNEYSELWYPDDVEEVMQYLDEGRYDYYSKRGAFNLGALPAHGSIEIRFHQGTLNYDEMESWIRFGQSLMDWVSYRRLPNMETPEHLFNKIKLERNASLFLGRTISRNRR